MSTIITLAVFFSIAGLIYSVHLTMKKKKLKVEQIILGRNDFHADKLYMVEFSPEPSGIAIDFTGRKLLIVNGDSHTLLDHSEIADVGIDVDDKSTAKANFGLQLAGSLVGGAIGGNKGAVLGALVAPIHAIYRVKKIDLLVRTIYLNKPELHVSFFYNPIAQAIDSTKVQEACVHFDEWLLDIMQIKGFIDENFVTVANANEESGAHPSMNNNALHSITLVISSFLDTLRSTNIEIYNEFSFQHELGAKLRNSLGSNWHVQFERPCTYFGIENNLVKKEIDISIFNDDKSEIYAIELKYPRNGQHPEQMYSFCKDICFLEQLCIGGMSGAWFVAVVDDHLYYEGDAEGIYAHFRGRQPIHGRIEKPTGRDRAYLEIEGSYVPEWIPINDPMRGLVIQVSCATRRHKNDLQIPATVQGEPYTNEPNPSILEAVVEQTTNSDPNKIFPLKLAQTYYDKGFFNVAVKYDTLVRRADGSIPLVLGSTGKRIRGRINRKANPQTGNARIYGGRELGNWFKLHFKPLDTVNVDLSSFNEIRLFKPDG